MSTLDITGSICIDLLVLCCRFSVREQVHILQQVSSALAKLHLSGVVHQDLHPGNVLQTLDGLHYKLSDLGSAAYHMVEDEPNMLQYSM